jgi:hypothetical protein
MVLLTDEVLVPAQRNEMERANAGYATKPLKNQ